MKQYTIINESCLDAMDKMEENSIDAIITDPPYEINFMSKKWDNTGIAFNVDTWKKAFRVLKPGGYLLAFNHSRTFHRLAVAIEDAGFQIRDTIMWLYGSGFPKSHNVGKSIETKLTLGSANKTAFKNLKGDVKKVKQGYIKMQVENGDRPREMQTGESIVNVEYTSPIAKKWDGWGTALKPAYEPIIMARKPIVESVANNILKYGVGAININDCRIGDEEIGGGTMQDFRDVGKKSKEAMGIDKLSFGQVENAKRKEYETHIGRFPSNIIIDGSDEVVSGFPNTKGSKGSGLTATPTRSVFNKSIKGINRVGYDDDGSASRFFYTSKASKRDRDEGLEERESEITTDGRNVSIDNAFLRGETKRKNIHPTVKPTDLMQYLIRLVAPKGSKILDIFMGSGSTGKACMLENVDKKSNYHFIGVELEKKYCDIAKARIEWAINYKDIEIEKSEKRMVGEKEAKQLSIFEMLGV